MSPETPKQAPEQKLEKPKSTENIREKAEKDLAALKKDVEKNERETRIAQLKFAVLGASEAASDFVDIADEWLEGMVDGNKLPKEFVESLKNAKQWSDTPQEDRQEYFVEFLEILTEAVAHIDKKDPKKMWKDEEYEELVEGTVERILNELKKTSYKDTAEKVEKSFKRQGEWINQLSQAIKPTEVQKPVEVKTEVDAEIYAKPDPDIDINIKR